MRVLILAERFYPEDFLINDLAREWVKNGVDVEVLTQTPSYPMDKVFDGYKNKFFQTTEGPDGIRVHRVATILGYNKSLFRKILNYASFAFLTSLWALFKGRKYDAVFVYQTGPLTMATANLVTRYIHRIPSAIWTQDVWPYGFYAYGRFKRTFISELFINNLVRLIYSACDNITVSCRGFCDELKPFTKKNVEFIPQWSIDTDALPPKKDTDKVVFTFAGNIGTSQNIEMLVDAFVELKSENAVFQIVGDGNSFKSVKAKVEQYGVDNVIMFGRKPRGEMPKYFEQSDVLVISLKEGIGMWLPSKFQAYIASGRPIFGVLEGETADLINKYDIGLTASPKSKDDIKKTFEKFLSADCKNKFSRWEANALNLSKTMFDRKTIIEKLKSKLIF